MQEPKGGEQEGKKVPKTIKNYKREAGEGNRGKVKRNQKVQRERGFEK